MPDNAKSKLRIRSTAAAADEDDDDEDEGSTILLSKPGPFMSDCDTGPRLFSFVFVIEE
jgi:hypothetical protein